MSEPTEWTAQIGNPKLNYIPWVIMMCPLVSSEIVCAKEQKQMRTP